MLQNQDNNIEPNDNPHMYLLKIISLSTILMVCACNTQPEKKEITVEWIYSEDAKTLSAVHSYHWLEDNTAILFDRRKPKEKRTFLKLDPEDPGQIDTIVDHEKAISSLQEHIGKEDSTEYLDWPLSFGPYGKHALYLSLIHI